ncbi:YegP family protein [Pseudomonas aeruginosa]
MNDTWEIYKDKAGEWRWTRTASNGRIVGASSQGYVNRVDCVSNAQRNGYTGS